VKSLCRSGAETTSQYDRIETAAPHGAADSTLPRRIDHAASSRTLTGVAHIEVNRSELPAAFVGAHTDPNEQESLVMRGELDVLCP